jgi:hypothetical protein
VESNREALLTKQISPRCRKGDKRLDKIAAVWIDNQLEDIASAKLNMVHYTDYLSVLDRRFVPKLELKKGAMAAWRDDEVL